MHSVFLKWLSHWLFRKRLFEKISLKNICFLLDALAQIIPLHFPEYSMLEELAFLAPPKS
jgi:hypothetical protein